MKEGHKKAERFAQAMLIIGITVVMVFGLLLQTYTTAKWAVHSHHPAAEIVMDAAEQIGVDTRQLVQTISATREVENTIRSAIRYGISRITLWNHPSVLANDLYYLWQYASSQHS